MAVCVFDGCLVQIVDESSSFSTDLLPISPRLGSVPDTLSSSHCCLCSVHLLHDWGDIIRFRGIGRRGIFMMITCVAPNNSVFIIYDCYDEQCHRFHCLSKSRVAPKHLQKFPLTNISDAIQQTLIKMKLRLRIFDEIEIRIPSIAKSTVSCKKS